MPEFRIGLFTLLYCFYEFFVRGLGQYLRGHVLVTILVGEDRSPAIALAILPDHQPVFFGLLLLFFGNKLVLEELQNAVHKTNATSACRYNIANSIIEFLCERVHGSCFVFNVVAEHHVPYQVLINARELLNTLSGNLRLGIFLNILKGNRTVRHNVDKRRLVFAVGFIFGYIFKNRRSKYNLFRRNSSIFHLHAPDCFAWSVDWSDCLFLAVSSSIFGIAFTLGFLFVLGVTFFTAILAP